ncbi:hypothetical protein IIC65_01080 [Candidatus Sumerlaeota bacterium]|nr:hypothetical protein [Candidatus Sumerlaeota bacterium]
MTGFGVGCSYECSVYLSVDCVECYGCSKSGVVCTSHSSAIEAIYVSNYEVKESVKASIVTTGMIAT